MIPISLQKAVMNHINTESTDLCSELVIPSGTIDPTAEVSTQF